MSKILNNAIIMSHTVMEQKTRHGGGLLPFGAGQLTPYTNGEGKSHRMQTIRSESWHKVGLLFACHLKSRVRRTSSMRRACNEDSQP